MAKPKSSKASDKAKPVAASKTIKKAKAPVKSLAKVKPTAPKTVTKAKASPAVTSKTTKAAAPKTTKAATPKTTKAATPKITKKAKSPVKKALPKVKPAASKTVTKAKAKPAATPKAKPAATPKTAKNDDTSLFKSQITRLGKSKTERDALVEIITLFDDKRKGSNLPDDVVTSLINALKKQLKNKNHAMISDSLSSLSYIVRVKKYVPIVIKSNVLKLIVPFLDSSEDDLIVPAMNVFGNVAENDSEVGVKAVVDAGVLKHLKRAFTFNEEEIWAKAIWLLRKLCATTGGQDDFLKDIFDEGLIVNIVNHLDASNHVAKVDAFYALQDLTSFADEKQILEIVDGGAISDICNFFGFGDSDLNLVALNCLSDILSKSGKRAKEVAQDIRGCGGYDTIAEMQEDDDEFIRDSCQQLIEAYFQ